MKYTVYFEFFGRRMKTEVEAPSEGDARKQIQDRINFIRVDEQEEPGFIKFFNDVIGGRK